MLSPPSALSKSSGMSGKVVTGSSNSSIALMVVTSSSSSSTSWTASATSLITSSNSPLIISSTPISSSKNSSATSIVSMTSFLATALSGSSNKAPELLNISIKSLVFKILDGLVLTLAASKSKAI